MYDFKNSFVNKLIGIAVAFVAFIILSLALPGVVSTILIVTFFWLCCGLIGWGVDRIAGNGKVEDEEGVPFYKEDKFIEYLVRGPVNLFRYFS